LEHWEVWLPEPAGNYTAKHIDENRTGIKNQGFLVPNRGWQIFAECFWTETLKVLDGWRMLAVK